MEGRAGQGRQNSRVYSISLLLLLPCTSSTYLPTYLPAYAPDPTNAGRCCSAPALGAQPVAWDKSLPQLCAAGWQARQARQAGRHWQAVAGSGWRTGGRRSLLACLRRQRNDDGDEDEDEDAQVMMMRAGAGKRGKERKKGSG